MKICVHGLWHLGLVTAACLAERGHTVVGIDDDAALIAEIEDDRLPLFEPGLADLVAAGRAAGRLRFSSDPEAAGDAGMVWACFDTPVDDQDRADVSSVTERIKALLPHLKHGTTVLVSSQLPVGSTRSLSDFARNAGMHVQFAYSPENLRLGKAIEAFMAPERIIVGTEDTQASRVLAPVLGKFSGNIQWVSLESAEMSKHALNVFLAVCVTYINEIATLCEKVGADASDVESALRSEPRIGPKAYIRPGAAFAGGTLARDVNFVSRLAAREGVVLPMIDGILPSNEAHRGWPLRQLQMRLGTLAGKTVAILGLSYKPGTSTLRRSSSVELCRALLSSGAIVRATDPMVKILPADLAGIHLAADAVDACRGADAVVVMTEWPEFKSLDADTLIACAARPLVLDQNRFLAGRMAGRPEIRFVTIGTPE